MSEQYDFGGWATRINIKCADGRTIRDGAFKDDDGKVVPIVFQHIHDDPRNVLGHGLLEYRPGEGVYVHGKFNDTENGQTAKSLVNHGDIKSLSIYANKLKQQAGNVMHGCIREVSLVLAGANDGAFIDFPIITHSEDGEDEVDEMVACMNEAVVIEHAAEDKPADENGESPEKKENKEMADNNEKTLGDIWDSMNEDQKNLTYFMVGKAVEDSKEDKSDNKGEETVSHNIFENDTPETFLSHADMEQIFRDGKKMGSLKAAVEHHLESGVLAHASDDQGNYLLDDDGNKVRYGMANIDYLFPDAKMLGEPEVYKRDTGWVGTVMNGVHHTPFSRIKTMAIDITMDEARALGYMKGNRKKEEIFSVMKRVTSPQTIYKKAKLDRDDIIDITDFNVVAFQKKEMREMLDEEVARAILMGDGRLADSEDKIHETNVRPIYNDDTMYTVKIGVVAAADATDDEKAKAFRKAVIKNRKQYRGSGNITMFCSEDMLADLLLEEDGMGRPMYRTETELATALRVKRIVTVPLMENLTLNVASADHAVLAIMVDLNDYAVGADKGGAVNMFEDFDIDYNQEKYLLETRISGALRKLKSAMTFFATTEEIASL